MSIVDWKRENIHKLCIGCFSSLPCLYNADKDMFIVTCPKCFPNNICVGAGSSKENAHGDYLQKRENILRASSDDESSTNGPIP